MEQRLIHNPCQVKTLTGKTIYCWTNLSIHTVSDLKLIIQDREGIPVEQQILVFSGEKLEDEQMLNDYGIRNESIIYLTFKLRGGKPVIYLFPPTNTTDIQVRLSLVNSWTFSDIYPSTTITAPIVSPETLGQTVTWTLDAQPDGMLRDHETGREIAYLFWEARTIPRLLSSPPSTRPSSLVGGPSCTFDPASPILLPSHSALLPLDRVTGYIDNVLLALGLHTEARTSFITYWLPDISKHAFIALRFLPQAEYEKAALLDVTPEPEATTRVSMLFRGVEESQLELWFEAEEMAQNDVAMWRDVVGVDIAKTRNKSLFRVLEWGGMEVK
ncbi:hypothetical protein OPQ81_001154 [Rhizoctonia solani]|nr:hypothetical protein OPQ81_001154 [Rhizoctonia solani]